MKKGILASILAAGVVGMAASVAMAAGGAGAGAGGARAGAAGARAGAGGNGPAAKHPGLRLAALLDLTADQKAQIKTILQAAHKEAQNAAGKDKLRIWRDAFRKITTTVLTAEQQKKLAEMLGRFKGQGAGGPRNRIGAHARPGAAPAK